MTDTTTSNPSMADPAGQSAPTQSADVPQHASAGEAAPSPAPAEPISGPARVDPFEAAAQRAEAKIKARQEKTAASTVAEHAGADTSAAVSTPADPGAAVADAATRAPGEAPAASTADAPQNWPAERRDAFAKLPDEARSLVMSFHKDMQAGFTRATQEVAQIKQQADDFSRLQAAAKADPEGFLRGLAQQLGVTAPVAAEAEPPEFSTIQEATAWAAEQGFAKARDWMTRERQAEQAALAQSQARGAFEAELAEVRRLPGFAEVEDQAVQAVIGSQGFLSLRQAYDLARVQDLEAKANRAAVLEAQLAGKARTEETRRKGLGLPVAGTGHGSERPAQAGGPVNRFEGAFQRAQERRERG